MQPTTAITTQPPNIIIIEDEAEIAETVQFAVERAGMSVQWANTGGKGLALMSDDIDLIILDIGLPDQDGFEVLKTLRQTYETPVIMLTAQQEELDRVLGLELGADDFVGKPFSPRELIARIKAILKRTGDSREHSAADLPDEQQRDHPFDFDEAQQHYRYDEQVIAFTLAEQRLFGTMLAQPGRVFSREQLLTAIWSDNHPTEARAIDTHIKSIRGKLRDIAPERQYIVTHRGLGYSLALGQS